MSAALLISLLALLAGCGEQPAPVEAEAAEAEVPAIAVTRWSDATELFMEHPPLRVGERSRFAIHLTDLRTFLPLTEGRVTVRLLEIDGTEREFSTSHPSRPGIFGVDVIPRMNGPALLHVDVRSAAVEDSHNAGDARVRGGSPDGKGDFFGETPFEAREEEGGIAFLKEQQWTLDFATQVAEVGSMRRSVLVPAVVEPRSGGRVTLTAPVSGLLLPTVELPALGASVSAGETLGAIAPLWSGPWDPASLQFEVDEAETVLAAAVRDRERAARLLAAGAVPARRLQEAESREAVASARLGAARARIAQFEATRQDDPHADDRLAFSVRTHLAGVVTSVRVADGAHVQHGDTLFEIAATDLVHVAGALPESEARVLGGLRGAEVLVPGSPLPLPVERLVSTARVVDPETRTLKATYLVNNERNTLAIGLAATLRLFTEEAVEAPTVPQTAVVEDGGRTLLYVQTAGESFEERQVTTGNRRAGNVQIVSGLRAGERVVTRGAYLVRLASMSDEAPAHGHVH